MTILRWASSSLWLFGIVITFPKEKKKRKEKNECVLALNALTIRFVKCLDVWLYNMLPTNIGGRDKVLLRISKINFLRSRFPPFSENERKIIVKEGEKEIFFFFLFISSTQRRQISSYEKTDILFQQQQQQPRSPGKGEEEKRKKELAHIWCMQRIRRYVVDKGRRSR